MTYLDATERAEMDKEIIYGNDGNFGMGWDEGEKDYCCVCDSYYSEADDEFCHCHCSDCGEELEIDSDGNAMHCENCCECPTCYPDEVRYYLWDTLGVARDFDVASIVPSRETLETAAADYPKALELIPTVLEWLEEKSWNYASQALFNKDLTAYAKVVTALAREHGEVSN